MCCIFVDQVAPTTLVTNLTIRCVSIWSSWKAIFWVRIEKVRIILGTINQLTNMASSGAGFCRSWPWQGVTRCHPNQGLTFPTITLHSNGFHISRYVSECVWDTIFENPMWCFTLFWPHHWTHSNDFSPYCIALVHLIQNGSTDPSWLSRFHCFDTFISCSSFPVTFPLPCLTLRMVCRFLFNFGK